MSSHERIRRLCPDVPRPGGGRAIWEAGALGAGGCLPLLLTAPHPAASDGGGAGLAALIALAVLAPMAGAGVDRFGFRLLAAAGLGLGVVCILVLHLGAGSHTIPVAGLAGAAAAFVLPAAFSHVLARAPQRPVLASAWVLALSGGGIGAAWALVQGLNVHPAAGEWGGLVVLLTLLAGTVSGVVGGAAGESVHVPSLRGRPAAGGRLVLSLVLALIAALAAGGASLAAFASLAALNTGAELGSSGLPGNAVGLAFLVLSASGGLLFGAVSERIGREPGLFLVLAGPAVLFIVSAYPAAGFPWGVIAGIGLSGGALPMLLATGVEACGVSCAGRCAGVLLGLTAAVGVAVVGGAGNGLATGTDLAFSISAWASASAALISVLLLRPLRQRVTQPDRAKFAASPFQFTDPPRTTPVDRPARVKHPGG